MKTDLIEIIDKLTSLQPALRLIELATYEACETPDERDALLAGLGAVKMRLLDATDQLKRIAGVVEG